VSNAPAGLRVDIFHHIVLDSKLADAIQELREIMVTKTEFVTQLGALQAQLEKSKAEEIAAISALTTQVATLQAAIDAAGSDVPPEIITAFQGVQAASQALDDLNPDAPAAG
jgi:hypothetical protein